MLIVCPSCATPYDVGLASLAPNGRYVRCARCRTVWHAEPDRSDRLLAAAAALAPGRLDAAAEGRGTVGPSVPRTAGKIAGGMPDEAPAAHGMVAAATEDPESGLPAEAEPLPSGDSDTTEVQAPPIVPTEAGGDDGPPIEAIDHSVEQPRTPPEDVETAAERRAERNAEHRRLRWPLSQLQTGILALALINVLLVGWRSDVVRALPQTASFYALLGLPVNLRGLTFNDVVTGTEKREGVPILVIEGNVVNVARKIVDVPRLKFVVRNAARQEIYSWTAAPARNALQPGEAEHFRVRLASPPPEARDVILRFVNRRDILVGMR